jgi:hypothetical protein
VEEGITGEGLKAREGVGRAPFISLEGRRAAGNQRGDK